MNSPSFLIALLLAIVSYGVHAAPGVLPLNACELQEMKLESAPACPAGMVREDSSEHRHRESNSL